MGYPKREVRLVGGAPHLRCRTCDTWKPAEEYYDGESSSLFRSTYCRPCHRERNRKAQTEKRRRLGRPIRDLARDRDSSPSSLSPGPT